MKQLQRIVFIIPAIMLSAPLLFSQTGEKEAEHIQRKVPTLWDFLFQPRFFVKILVMLALGLAVFALLKTKKMNKGLKVVLLLFTTLLFGFAGNVFTYFAMHPSPMCAATKGFLYGFQIPFIIVLGVIFLLTFIGPRLFCGWVCPVGALQELIAMLADKLEIRRGRFSFTAAHGVRLFIFLLFIFLSVTAVLNTVYEGEVYALSIYDYLNPFHGMEFGAEANLLEYIIHYLPLLLTIVLAIKYYRPFCHFACPIGLFTHWMEQAGLFRIRFKKNACTDCGICESKSPCTAITEILKDAALRPDCYACNECIARCPENALDIGIKPTID